MTDLIELAERCEKAAGPDRNLDAMIHARDGIEGVGHWADAPAFTASLDAAMSLVPKGKIWHVNKWANGAADASVGIVHPYTPGPRCTAAAPALALCAAALRARSTQRIAG